MQRFFSSFPAGRAGAGLLLLRVAAAASLIIDARSWPIAVSSLAVAVALLMLVGFVTPIAGSLAAAAGVYGDPYLFVIAAAIVLLGPGAFSIDARLFGRREIIV